MFITVKGAGVGTLFPGRSCAIGRDVYAYLPSSGVTQEFAQLALAFTINRIVRDAAGLIPGLSRDHILKHEIALPPSSEQQRLVAKMDVLQAKVQSLRSRLDRIPITLKRFRRAVLAAACEGKLTSDWRKHHSPKEAARVTLKRIRENLPKGGSSSTTYEQGGELPNTWVRCSISQMFTVQTGATPLKSNPEYHTGGTIPWVKTGEVQNGEIWKAAEHITPKAITETNAKVFPPGTLLIAMYGEGKTRGQVGRLRIAASTNQACAALVNPKLPAATNEYVFYCALSQYHRLRAEAVGGNQPNLSLGIIKEWEINFPPLDEQEEIVRRIHGMLDVADRLQVRYDQARAHVDRLTQALLAKALRGELVPTEAEMARREGRSYETAEQLLARIKSSSAIKDVKSERVKLARTGRK